MVALGIVEKKSCSSWTSLTLIIPKPNGKVRMVSDFRKSNANLVQKPYSIPKISGVMQELEEFTRSYWIQIWAIIPYIWPQGLNICVQSLPLGENIST